MALEEVVANISNTGFFSIFPPEILNYLDLAILALKAAGVFLAIYIAIQIVNLVLNIKKNNRIKRMENKINELDKKINILIKGLEKKKGRS